MRGVLCSGYPGARFLGSGLAENLLSMDTCPSTGFFPLFLLDFNLFMLSVEGLTFITQDFT